MCCDCGREGLGGGIQIQKIEPEDYWYLSSIWELLPDSSPWVHVSGEELVSRIRNGENKCKQDAILTVDGVT